MNNREYKDFKTRVLRLIQYFLSTEQKYLEGVYTEKRKMLASSKIALLRDLYDDIKAMEYKD